MLGSGPLAVLDGADLPADLSDLLADGLTGPPPGDIAELFGTDIFDLLVASHCFPSKAQARKNWRGEALQTGYTELGPIGKHKTYLFIWSPSE